MPRGKTARRRKAKRQTYRKPKIYTSVLENNYNNSINNNTAENLRYFAEEQSQELFALEYERFQKWQLETAIRNLESLPPNTFRIKIWGSENRRIGLSLSGSKIMRVMDLVNFIQERRERFFRPLQILYKGETPEEDYYYLIWYTSQFTEEQEVLMENLQEQEGVFNVWRLDPLDYYLDRYIVEPDEEPDTFFFYPAKRTQFLTFLMNLPHFREKNKAERVALVTAPAKHRALQMTGINKMMQTFTEKTGREVPENVEGVIKTFI